VTVPITVIEGEVRVLFGTVGLYAEIVRDGKLVEIPVLDALELLRQYRVKRRDTVVLGGSP
jgi:hypothetical protein